MVPKWPELLQYCKKTLIQNYWLTPEFVSSELWSKKKLDFVALLGAKTPLKPALSVGLSLSSNKFDKVTLPPSVPSPYSKSSIYCLTKPHLRSYGRWSSMLLVVWDLSFYLHYHCKKFNHHICKEFKIFSSNSDWTFSRILKTWIFSES